MSYILRIAKKSFLWSYPRTTWQWDVLCLLILGFIFLTPKSWFEGSERYRWLTHQKNAVSTVILGPEVIDDMKDRGQLEQRVRVITGRAQARIVEMRPRLDKNGKTLAYEIDIR